MKGTRVKILQRALKTLKYYKKTVDGKFGSATKKAVRSFQKAADLKVDGKAGKKTLKAIEKALASGGTSSSGSASSGSSSGDESDTQSSGNTANIPSIGSVSCCCWFNDIKPRLKNGQYLKLVDPATGLTWTLRLYSLGRHADAEPLTERDTANMVEAFGGQKHLGSKAVYVKPPDRTWTIGSTHDMPHMSGSISNNNFNGHLCVHFLRDMSRCQQNDPKIQRGQPENDPRLLERAYGYHGGMIRAGHPRKQPADMIGGCFLVPVPVGCRPFPHCPSGRIPVE